MFKVKKTGVFSSKAQLIILGYVRDAEGEAIRLRDILPNGNSAAHYIRQANKLEKAKIIIKMKERNNVYIKAGPELEYLEPYLDRICPRK